MRRLLYIPRGDREQLRQIHLASPVAIARAPSEWTRVRVLLSSGEADDLLAEWTNRDHPLDPATPVRLFFGTRYLPPNSVLLAEVTTAAAGVQIPEGLGVQMVGGSERSAPQHGLRDREVRSALDGVLGHVRQAAMDEWVVGVRLDDGPAPDLPTRIVKRSTDSNDTTTLATDSELVFRASAGVTYRVRVLVRFATAATTTGISLAMTGPTASWIAGRTWNHDAATTQNFHAWNAWDTQTVGAGAVSGSNLAVIDLLVQPSADGPIALRFRSEVNTSQVDVLPGSVLEVQPIA